MNYYVEALSATSKEVINFVENPTEKKNITLLFSPPPDNQSTIMCLVKRRYGGWLKSEYFDLYLQLAGVPIYIITARRKEVGFKSTVIYTIPFDLQHATPLVTRYSGLDRLQIGSLCSNLCNTRFQANVDENLRKYLHHEKSIRGNTIQIQYKMNFLSSWKPYEMTVFTIDDWNYTIKRGDPIVESCVKAYRSKMPIRDPFTNTYVMDFNNRVTIPSIKNFQLVDDCECVILQFGRVGTNTFTMDFKVV